MADNFTDTFSRHAHFVERHKTHLTNQADVYLKRIARELRKELLKTDKVVSQKRIQAKLAFVEQVVSGQLKEYKALMIESLEAFALSEVKFAEKTLKAEGALEKTAKVGVVLSTVKNRTFNKTQLNDFLDDFIRTQTRAIKSIVSEGFVTGATTREILTEITGTRATRGADGALATAKNSISRAVRTSATHTSVNARDQVFKANEKLIPYYEWVSTLDSRTSNICKALDGQVFEVGKGKLPPAHPNCRSTTSPLFKDEVEKDSKGNLVKIDLGGTRASQFGQVSADLSYNDWLKKQSKAFQVEALGKSRAELFRKGGLTVDKFTDRFDAPLTLEQLEEMFPIAWEKAEL